jgi:hypothetical protein
MTDFDSDAHLDSIATAGFDPDTHLDHAAPTTVDASAVSPEESVRRLVAHEATTGLAAIPAGLRSLYDITLGGKSVAETDQRYHQFIQEHSYNPPDPTSQQLADVYDRFSGSRANPLTWPARAADVVAENMTKGSAVAREVDRLKPTTGGSPAAAPIISGALQFGAGVAGMRSPEAPGKTPAWNRTPEAPPDLALAPSGGRPSPVTESPPVSPQASPDLTLAPSAGRAVPNQPAPAPQAPLSASGAPRGTMFEPTDTQKPFMAETKAAATPEATASPAVKTRAQVLQEVGLPQARTSALTNNGPAAMSEFQTSRDPTTPQGLEARRIFDSERGALTDYGNRIVSRTGGTAGTDGATLETRGGTILQPFDGLQDYFDTQRKAAYTAADERAKGVPTDLKGFQGVLKDESNLTNQDRVGLKGGLTAYLKKLGVVDDNGNITASVQQAETVRKYLNEEWSPANSKFVGKLKDALDDDVTKAAGDDVYKSSRAIVKLQKDILENPKGISDVLDASGPNGINRKVPVGQVADKIMNLPPAQLQHIVSTLEGVPPELQPQAQAALSELRSHFASRLSEVGNKFDGPWNHRGVNQFLDTHSARAPIIFGSDNPLLKDMNTLRAAGNILRVDRSYPGAAIQGRILQSKLIPGAIATAGSIGGEAIGSAMGMPGVGTAVGGAAGGAAALKMSQRAGVKAMQARMTNLSDLMKAPQ